MLYVIYKQNKKFWVDIDREKDDVKILKMKLFDLTRILSEEQCIVNRICCTGRELKNDAKLEGLEEVYLFRRKAGKVLVIVRYQNKPEDVLAFWVCNRETSVLTLKHVISSHLGMNADVLRFYYQVHYTDLKNDETLSAISYEEGRILMEWDGPRIVFTVTESETKQTHVISIGKYLTVGDLRMAAAGKFSIPFPRLRLSRTGARDSAQFLQYFDNVSELFPENCNDRILFVHILDLSDFMHIMLKILTGKQVALEVSTEYCVAEIKIQIQDREGFPPDQ